MVDLSNNNLTELPSGIFGENYSLRAVNLANNRLTHLPELLGPFMDLVGIDLSGNKFSHEELKRIENMAISFKGLGGRKPHGLPRSYDNFRTRDRMIMKPCCIELAVVQ